MYTTTNLYNQGSSALDISYNDVFDAASCDPGQIVWVHKGQSENYGKEIESNRPAVVLYNHGGKKLTVAYLTSSKQQLKNDSLNVRVVSHNKQGVVRYDKLQTVDVSRIGPYEPTTYLSGVEMAYVKRSVKKYLQKNKHYEELRKDKTQDINRFLDRGHAYRINSGLGEATGYELDHIRPGLIVSNTAILDKEDRLKHTVTLAISYGITKEEYDVAEDTSLYVSIPIYDTVNDTIVNYYFNAYELYETDVSRIDFGNCENYLGKLDEIQMRKLNYIISKIEYI